MTIVLDGNGVPLKYQHTTYAKGWALKVTPANRSADVMHHLMTGGLLGGRSLEGVTLEEVEQDSSAAKALARSMQITSEGRKK